MKSHDTHQPYGGDGPHDRVSGRWDGPTGRFWPNSATLRAYIDGTARGTTHGPSGGCVRSSTYQLKQQSVPRTAQSTGANSPSWIAWRIKLEWAHTERATWFRDSMRDTDWWSEITWDDWPREETLGGTPHGYTFLGETPRPGASGWLVQGTDN